MQAQFNFFYFKLTAQPKNIAMLPAAFVTANNLKLSFNKGFFLLILILIAFTSCAPSKNIQADNNILTTPENLLRKSIQTSAVFKNNFTGFIMVDAETHDTLYQQNANLYFTPASNTKLFTFYAATKLLGDSVPGLKYSIRNDSLIFWGTGDPSFLHPDLHGYKAFHFLKNRPEKLFYADAHYQTPFYGPGWSWDDYHYYFAAERSPLPIYGNVVKFSLATDAKLKTAPRFFKANVKQAPTGTTAEANITRDLTQNNFIYYPQTPSQAFTQEVPFRQSAALQVQLLSDTLGKPVKYIERWPTKEAKILYTYPTDSLYRRMLQVSDNFLAEQILTLCASTVSDTLSTESIIRYVTAKYLADLPDKPVWVDGSGLSRLNLFTPRTITALLHKMYKEIPRQKLFSLLVIGGKRGSLKNYYRAEPPFIFAKTGSLSNNFALSGFLITQSGKILIFSFMNNNYVVPGAAVRKEVERILTFVHQNY